MYATTQFSFDLGEDLSTLPAEIPARKKKVVPQFNSAVAAVVLQLAFDLPVPEASEEPAEVQGEDEDDVALDVAEAEELAALEELSESDAADVRQSLFEYLIETGHYRKLMDMSLNQANVPNHLREDAEGEIRFAWYMRKVKDGHSHSQTCKYALLAGKHAAFNIRRKLNGVVVLDGLFRNKQSKSLTEFMAMSAGCVFAPMDIDEHEDDAEFAAEPEHEERYASESEVERRLALLNLKPYKKEIARLACVEGLSAEDIVKLNLEAPGTRGALTVSKIQLVMADITKALNDYDGALN